MPTALPHVQQCNTKLNPTKGHLASISNGSTADYYSRENPLPDPSPIAQDSNLASLPATMVEFIKPPVRDTPEGLHLERDRRLFALYIDII